MTAVSGTSTKPLEECMYWQAEKRLLPPHLRASDNARYILHYKKALRNAMKSHISDKERDHIRMYYGKQMTKTQIGEIYGVGSSTVCKTLRSAEGKIREYVELYMQIYKLLENESFDIDDETNDICKGEINRAGHRIDSQGI